MIDRGGSQTFERYNNSGKGLAQGIQSQLRFDFHPIQGAIAYTLSRSTRSDNGGSSKVFAFDQTHNLNLILSYAFGKNWLVSTRYRYVTGNPLTPVISGFFDADNDQYLPRRGGYFSSRQTDFRQLDLRFDKKWIFDTQVWSFYLDILNVLNTKNSEGVDYSYNYSQRQDSLGLPFLPALGVRGDF